MTDIKSGIFFSYNSKDNEAVDSLYRSLKSWGFHKIWKDAVLGGQKWIEAIIVGIHDSNVMIICIGKAPISETQFIEIGVAAGEDKKIIPLRLPGAPAAKRLHTFMQALQIRSINSIVSQDTVVESALVHDLHDHFVPVLAKAPLQRIRTVVKHALSNKAKPDMAHLVKELHDNFTEIKLDYLQPTVRHATLYQQKAARVRLRDTQECDRFVQYLTTAVHREYLDVLGEALQEAKECGANSVQILREWVLVGWRRRKRGLFGRKQLASN